MTTEPDLDTSTLVETHDCEAGEDMDDGYSIALYKASDERHFIFIFHSDMSSKYDGSLGFHQWVASDDIGRWKDL